MNTATEKDEMMLSASADAMAAYMDDKASVTARFLKGPFTPGVVYQGLNCTPEHRVALQAAYDSLPQLVRAAFEKTGFHVEGCGNNLDMAVRLACPPPEFALGVTNYQDTLVMVCEQSVGKGPKGDMLCGSAAKISPLNTTLAHEIGHVLDKCCGDGGLKNRDDFIKAMADDVAHGLIELKRDYSDYKSACDDQRARQLEASLDPCEAFAEAFAYAIGFGGSARGDFAKMFPKCIETVRGWFERNYDKIGEFKAAA